MTATPSLDPMENHRHARTELLRQPAYKIGWMEGKLAARQHPVAVAKHADLDEVVQRLQRDVFRLSADARARDDDARAQRTARLEEEQQAQQDRARMHRVLQEQVYALQEWAQCMLSLQERIEHQEQAAATWMAGEQERAQQQADERREHDDRLARIEADWVRRDQDLQQREVALAQQGEHVQQLVQRAEQALDQQGRWYLELQSLRTQIERDLQQSGVLREQQMQALQSFAEGVQKNDAQLQNLETLQRALQKDLQPLCEQTMQMQQNIQCLQGDQRQLIDTQHAALCQVTEQQEAMQAAAQEAAALRARVEHLVQRQERLHAEQEQSCVLASQSQQQAQGLLQQTQSLWARIESMEGEQRQGLQRLQQQQQAAEQRQHDLLAQEERMQALRVSLSEADVACQLSQQALAMARAEQDARHDESQSLLQRIEQQAERERQMSTLCQQQLQQQEQWQQQLLWHTEQGEDLRQQIARWQGRHDEVAAIAQTQAQRLQEQEGQIQHWQQLARRAMHKLKEIELAQREFSLHQQEHQWLLQQARQEQALLHRERQELQARLQQIEAQMQEWALEQGAVAQDESWRPALVQLQQQLLELKIDRARRQDDTVNTPPAQVMPEKARVAKPWWQRSA